MAGGGAAAGAAAAGDRSLRDTPTWAVALVCAVLLILSILIEHGIHSLSKWFQKRQKKAMSEALEKIKAGGDDDDHRRKLLLYSGDVMWRRVLAAPAGGDDYCSRKGQVSLISLTGLHQLHIFIFVLAVFHVLYSVITIALAKAKMKKWQAWELETNSLEYQFTNDPARFRFTHQTSFVKRHSGLSRTPGIRWIVAFFRQFFGSVSKVDYMTMRHGFINAHFAPNTSFDFHKYIKRSLEDDFKVVVGISIPLWIVAVIFLLVNVYKWDSLSWLTVAPLVIILLVGTKLELVIMEMAQEIQDRTTVVRGAPVVEPNNKFFWFNRPEWILFLIHYTLFQYEFGIHSCFHENLPLILTRVIVGVALQFLCSYITFPLYALVTQMGSHMKKSIFEEQTAKALKKWQKAAKERRRSRNKAAAGADKCSGIMSIHGHGSPSPPSSGFLSGENTPSQGASPIHLLHHYKYRSNQQDIESVRSYQSDNELSEIEPSSTHHHHQDQGRDEDLHNSDFSFVKL
ncbi:MLO-like protein [Citrus sinensis]|uniref:MLO-like protein n=1 Tax=Citrus sinensis TaxID=2711 RepID=A0ACB8KZM2_CITSI|nr:MLO-like protein [Citrus sinensis]